MVQGSKLVKSAQLGLLATLVVAVQLGLYSNQARAQQLPLRSLRLTSGVPGSTTSHAVGFTYIAGSVVGSASFSYCSNSPIIGDACIAPVGMDATSAVIAAQSGLVGFTMSAATNANTIVINRVPGVVPSVSSTYEFSGVVNPTTSSFYYVRIQLYDAQDMLGTPGDEGSVAFAINPALTITAYVPPYLTFCAGKVVSTDCSAITGDPLVDLGVFTPSAVSSTTTEFSGATNIPSGYSVSVLGSTMTAGTYEIDPLITTSASIPGSSQFGINLRANGLVAGSSDPVGLGTAVPQAGYNTPNMFSFQDGGVIAGASGPTHYTRFTVSYIVNVPTSQRSGLYATTLSYVAIANL